MDTSAYQPAQDAITMFSTTWCGYCKTLKTQLDAMGIAYTEVNIEEDDQAAKLVESVNDGNQVVPTVLFADGSTATNPPAAQVRAKLAN